MKLNSPGVNVKDCKCEGEVPRSVGDISRSRKKSRVICGVSSQFVDGKVCHKFLDFSWCFSRGSVEVLEVLPKKNSCNRPKKMLGFQNHPQNPSKSQMNQYINKSDPKIW